MKSVVRWFSVVMVAGCLATSAFAGECCDKAAGKAREGKACAACVKKECCKEAVKKLGSEAKECVKCAKK